MSIFNSNWILPAGLQKQVETVCKFAIGWWKNLVDEHLLLWSELQYCCFLLIIFFAYFVIAVFVFVVY
jgi:hypothetical protein